MFTFKLLDGWQEKMESRIGLYGKRKPLMTKAKIKRLIKMLSQSEVIEEGEDYTTYKLE